MVRHSSLEPWRPLDAISVCSRLGQRVFKSIQKQRYTAARNCHMTGGSLSHVTLRLWRSRKQRDVSHIMSRFWRDTAMSRFWRDIMLAMSCFGRESARMMSRFGRDTASMTFLGGCGCHGFFVTWFKTLCSALCNSWQRGNSVFRYFVTL